MKTIVVPTDCSELSLNALRYADRIAAKRGATVVAVYGAIFERPDGVGVAASLASADDREMMMAPVRRCIEDGLAHALSADTKREIVLEDCEAADAIVDVAHTRKADLIIIGTHDRNRLLRAVLGSVTDEVLRVSRCPVLVLREHNCASANADRVAAAVDAALAGNAHGDSDDGALVVVTDAASPIIRTAHCPVLVVKH